jgi:ATP-binding cassette subfamily B protein RaxB
MTMQEASRHYTGVALELSPAPDFQYARKRPSVSLRQLTGKVIGWPRAASTVLLLAVTLELLLILTPLLVQWIIDGALAAGDYDLIALIGGGLAASFVLQGLISLARSWTTLFVSTRLKTQWYGNVFSHMLRLPLSYFEQRFLGSIASRFDSITTIQRTISGNFVETIIDGLAALLMLAAMFFYSPLLGAFVVASVMLYLAVRFATYKPLKQATEVYLAKFGKQQTLLLETLRGIRPLRLFQREDEQRMRWHATQVDATNSQLAAEKLGVVVRSANMIVFGLQTVAIVWLGAHSVLDGRLSIGMFVAFLVYKELFNTRMALFLDRLFELRLMSVQLDRLADIVLTGPDDAQAFPSGPVPLAQGAMQISGLWFRHSEADPWLLKNLDLPIRPGECIAITGPSGVGKSTLVKLMATLLKPCQGEISIGGTHQVAAFGSSDKEKAPIAFVMQDDTLFAGSILENITFFAIASRPEWVVQCAQIACIHDEIMQMPMGYETLIGDMGGALSGGQRQRILLARALFCNPAILVLDEATSHLDTAMEARIAAALAKLSITRIIVAHRPETIRIAERILYFTEGGLEERVGKSVGQL